MTENLNAKEYIRKLINIAYLSIGIPLLLFIYVYLESTAETLVPVVAQEHNKLVFIPIFIVSLALVVLGNKKYKTHISEAREKNLLSEKFISYQKGTTVRFVSYSISSLLISIGFYLTDFQVFAALFGIMIVLFSINNPTARKVAHDLQLKNGQRDVVLKGLDFSDTNEAGE